MRPKATSKYHKLIVYIGTGGESIYGEKFEDEAFLVKHTKPFLLSMVEFPQFLFSRVVLIYFSGKCRKRH